MNYSTTQTPFVHIADVVGSPSSRVPSTSGTESPDKVRLEDVTVEEDTSALDSFLDDDVTNTGGEDVGNVDKAANDE